MADWLFKDVNVASACIVLVLVILVFGNMMEFIRVEKLLRAIFKNLNSNNRDTNKPDNINRND